MMCANLDPMIPIGGCIFIAWVIFMSSSYRENRDVKEDLMLKEALREFKQLLEKKKNDE